MAPAFEIGLRILNPNPQTLNLEGIVYTVSLQGHELVKASARISRRLKATVKVL
jgi:LEA14-like dessication related protein